MEREFLMKMSSYEISHSLTTLWQSILPILRSSSVALLIRSRCRTSHILFSPRDSSSVPSTFSLTHA